MNERAYYSVKLTPKTAATRIKEARAIVIEGSTLAHETPQIVVSPDGTSALVRAHWPRVKSKAVPPVVSFTGRNEYESSDHVTPITRGESAEIKQGWAA